MNLIDRVLGEMADEDGVEPDQFIRFAAMIYEIVVHYVPEGEFAVRLSARKRYPIKLQDNPSVRASIVQLIYQLRACESERRVVALVTDDGQLPLVLPVRLAT